MGSWLLLLGNLLVVTGEETASVSGVVRDAQTGAPIPGAVIALPLLGRTSRSDSLGQFQLARIPLGTWDLTVRRLGYTPWTIQILVPEQGILTVDFSLQPEPVPIPDLQVRAAHPVGPLGSSLGTTNAAGFPRRSLTRAELQDHPLIAEPDFFAGLSGGEVLVAPESPEGFHIAGGAADQVAFRLDGIPVLNPYHAAGTFGAWNPDVVASASLSSDPDGLSDVLGGTLDGRIRAATGELEVRGAATASQTRLALSRSIGPDGGGILLGLRAGFPGLLGHKREASHLGGHNHDWTAKLDLPALGGRLSLLAFGSGNRLGASPALALAPDPPADLDRHAFDWSSASYGVGWNGPLAGHLLQVRTWVATSRVAARWFGPDGEARLASTRRDLGVSAELTRLGTHSTTTAGLGLTAMRTGYDVLRPGGGGETMGLEGELPLVTATVKHQHRLTGGSGAQLSLTATGGAGQGVLGPAAGVWWRVAAPVTLSASFTRRYQHSQSLRNPESIVGAVFPVDLTVVGSSAGLSPARSDLAVLSLNIMAAAQVHIGVRVYAREARGLVLVAPRESGPFATAPAEAGAAATRGAVVELVARKRRLELRASYGYQRTWMVGEGIRYRPAAAVPHSLEAGLTLFPGEKWMFRAGLSGQAGRRATRITGPFEWEACNLTDRGCEFIGSPELTGPLGGVTLPDYLRLDLGLRHEWHPSLLGRDGTLAMFGTVTNLLARRNLLTVKKNPTDGTLRPVEMRPRAPLVVGLEWTF